MARRSIENFVKNIKNNYKKITDISIKHEIDAQLNSFFSDLSAEISEALKNSPNEQKNISNMFKELGEIKGIDEDVTKKYSQKFISGSVNKEMLDNILIPNVGMINNLIISVNNVLKDINKTEEIFNKALEKNVSKELLTSKFSLTSDLNVKKDVKNEVKNDVKPKTVIEESNKTTGIDALKEENLFELEEEKEFEKKFDEELSLNPEDFSNEVNPEIEREGADPFESEYASISKSDDFNDISDIEEENIEKTEEIKFEEDKEINLEELDVKEIDIEEPENVQINSTKLIDSLGDKYIPEELDNAVSDEWVMSFTRNANDDIDIISSKLDPSLPLEKQKTNLSKLISDSFSKKIFNGVDFSDKEPTSENISKLVNYITSLSDNVSKIKNNKENSVLKDAEFVKKACDKISDPEANAKEATENFEKLIGKVQFEKTEANMEGVKRIEENAKKAIPLNGKDSVGYQMIHGFQKNKDGVFSPLMEESIKEAAAVYKRLKESHNNKSWGYTFLHPFKMAAERKAISNMEDTLINQFGYTKERLDSDEIKASDAVENINTISLKGKSVEEYNNNLDKSVNLNNNIKKIREQTKEENDKNLEDFIQKVKAERRKKLEVKEAKTEVFKDSNKKQVNTEKNLSVEKNKPTK